MAKNLVKFFIIVDSYKIQILSRFLTETWDKTGLNNHDDSDNDIVRKKYCFNEQNNSSAHDLIVKINLVTVIHR